MCEYLRGMISKGREEERQDTLVQSIRNLMSTLQLSAQKAMEALAIPPAEYEKYEKLLLAHHQH